MAAIVFKDDHLLEAVTVAQQELQIVDIRLRETVTDKVNLFGVFQVVIGLGPQQVEKAPTQERFLRMRHRNEDGRVFAVDGETAVLRLDLADVFEVEFVACAFDGEPVERTMQFDKVYGAVGFTAFCRAVGRVNFNTVIHRNLFAKFLILGNCSFNKRVVIEREQERLAGARCRIVFARHQKFLENRRSGFV